MGIVIVLLILIFCICLANGTAPLFLLGVAGVVVLLIVIAIANSKKNDERNANTQSSIAKLLELEKFRTDRLISTHSATPFELRVDTTNQKIALCRYSDGLVSFFPFNQIIDCTVVDDHSTIIKGGKGGALVGGLIAGPVGAIIGSSKSSKDVINHMQIKIITSDISNALYTVPLISTETKRDSLIYKDALKIADEFHSTLISIINQKSDASIEKNSSNDSYEDRLRKLKSLFDDNILTEDEYNGKKKLLLDKIS